MLKTVLVIPCYNEAQRFPLTEFSAFLERQPEISLVLVNDGSRDGTLAVLERLASLYPGRVSVVDGKVNRGKAEAVRQGLLHALEFSGQDAIIGFWDADLATPLEAVVDLRGVFEERPEVQMVFGARVNLLGRRIERRPVRHYLGRIFATVISSLLALPIYDTQCGAKLFRAGPELRQVCRDAFGSRWVFDVEIIARWLRLYAFDRERLKRAVYEYPLHAWIDVAGSNVKPTDFLKAFFDVVRIYRRYLSTAARRGSGRG